jgi:hypothetical protein
MKVFIEKNRKHIAIAGICLLIAGITMSFYPLQFAPIQHYDSLSEVTDTIPAKEHNKMTMSEYDKLMNDLNADVQRALEEVRSIDADKLSKEIAASLKDLDADKIKMKLAQAMKEVDLASVEKELHEAMNNVQLNKINEQVKTSLEQAKKEIEKINMDVVSKEMEKAKLELKKSKDAFEKIDFDKIMKEAGASIDKAKHMLQLQKEFFTELEKDGLINTKDGFTIEYKDKSLYINGKKQSEAVTDKYRHYIPDDHYKITIEKE